MADDVTLRECPRCGCKHEPRETRDEKGHYMRECPRCRWRTGRYHTSKGAVFGWNNEEPLPDPAMAAAQEALRTCGIGGIYDDFRDLADAITQMATHIKEQDARIEELEARGEGDRLFLASLSEGLSMIGTCGECIHYQAGVCEMRGEPVGEYILALRRGTDLCTCFEEQHEEDA